MPEKVPPGMPPSPRIGERVIDCFGATTNRDRNEITWTIEMGLGGVSLHPCNLFHCLKYPHHLTNGAMDHSKDSPQGQSWASLEQRREASRSFSYKVRLIFRVQPSKRDDYTSTRQTPQQEEVQEWCRSTFWLRLVTRRKLLAALLPSVNSRTQEKSWWTCATAPHPHNEMGKQSTNPSSNHL